MKKQVVLCLLAFLPLALAAQWSCNNLAYTLAPNFTGSNQYYFMQSHFNPAYAGDVSQPSWWASIKQNKENNGNGQQYNFSWQGQFPEYKSNLGVIFNYERFNDTRTEVNPNSNNDIYDFKQWKLGVQHNYEFEVGSGTVRAGFGISLLRYADVYSGNTAGLVGEYKYRPNVDIGFRGRWGNFEFGVSALHSNEPNFRGETTQVIGLNKQAQFRRISYIHTAYEFTLGEAFYLKPSVQVRQLIGQRSYNSCGLSADASLQLNYNDSFFLAYSFRYHYQQYPHSIMLAYRTLGGYQFSASMDLPKGGTGERRRFEVGIGIFLFGDYYEEEEIDEEGF